MEGSVFNFKNTAYNEKKKKHKQPKNLKQNKSLRQICLNEMVNPYRINYLHIEAPTSTYPTKNYCDITGFEAKYKDRANNLYYADKNVYAYIKTLSKPIIDQYIAIRKAS